MKPLSKKLLTVAAVFVAAAAGGAGIAVAGGPDTAAGDDEAPLSGADLDRATAAALEVSREYGGGGTVTDTEGPDEEPYYEVDVRMPDGTEIDVELDDSFAVVGTPEVEGQDDAAGEVDDSGTDEPD
jgi:hypothetical protein